MTRTERHTAAGRARPALRTGCGRTLAVGCLRIEGPDRPVDRITLSIGPDRDGTGAAWVSLTAAEARRLSSHLLERAAAVDHGTAA